MISYIKHNLFLTPYNPLYRRLDSPPPLQGWIEHCDEEVHSPRQDLIPGHVLSVYCQSCTSLFSNFYEHIVWLVFVALVAAFT